MALAQWWYNNNYHTAHKMTPFEALFGYPPPIILVVMHFTPLETTTDQYLQARQEALQVIKRELATTQQRMKQMADRHRTNRTFEIGPVAYKLLPPDGVRLHPVFHVSFLKKAVSTTEGVSQEVLKLIEDHIVEVEPKAVLVRRVVYQDSLPLIEVLVQWTHLHLNNITWEYLPDLLQQYPRVASLL
ncbi:uncharacterized protein LOC127807684 [Diospyros lotus]|uniref:uncharacterized protein LOC127807684 n=1 Tax=Diospyros lotus TaxID=55363 RepID=UPI00225BCB4D|nr:uncharacterized protein LOC127807684 [Diospyros lotus]